MKKKETIPRYKRNKKYNKNRGKFRTDYPWRERQVIQSSNGNQYLFLHIHKTGGTSVKDFLIGKTLKKASHARASDIINEIGYEEFKKYKTFAVVRNPYDRVISAYFYMKNSERIPPSVTLNEFILNKKSEYSMYNEVCATPQYQYLCYDGKVECDVIIKFENLVKDFEQFINENDIIDRGLKNLPHDRKSKRDGYMAYLSGKKEMIKCINEFYEKDFEIFGYKKM